MCRPVCQLRALRSLPSEGWGGVVDDGGGGRARPPFLIFHADELYDLNTTTTDTDHQFIGVCGNQPYSPA